MDGGEESAAVLTERERGPVHRTPPAKNSLTEISSRFLSLKTVSVVSNIVLK